MAANPNTFTKPKQILATVLTAFDRRQLSSTHFERLLNLPMTVIKHVGPLTIRLQHVLPTVAKVNTLAPTASQANFDQAAEGDVDIVIYAHTHQPIMRYATTGQLILNAGTVGLPTAINPHLRQPRANYLLLTIDETGLQHADYRAVDFDWQRAITIAQNTTYPTSNSMNKLCGLILTNMHRVRSLLIIRNMTWPKKRARFYLKIVTENLLRIGRK